MFACTTSEVHRKKNNHLLWLFLRLEAERNISNSVLVVFSQIIFFGLLRRSGYLERKQAGNIAKNLSTIHTYLGAHISILHIAILHIAYCILHTAKNLSTIHIWGTYFNIAYCKIAYCNIAYCVLHTVKKLSTIHIWAGGNAWPGQHCHLTHWKYDWEK